MLTSDFDYKLPLDLIAQDPLESRNASKLLVLDRFAKTVHHRTFTDIGEYLKPDDVMVFNQSKVIPARFYGIRNDTKSKVEILLLRKLAEGVWEALAKPGRRLRPGVKVTVVNKDNKVSDLEIDILESNSDGIKTVKLSTEESIDHLGNVPLPPYIQHSLDNPDRYQTVYARDRGSVAAPTAGLHFTNESLDNIRNMGIITAFVTLHVGLDTFRPVQEVDPTQHHIHTEQYNVNEETAAILNKAVLDKRRIVAVGTTSVRVLEQIGQDLANSGGGTIEPCSRYADIFILPGHKFRLVDAMITNFHLPKSTLLMMVSAFAQPSEIKVVYEEAIKENYRFYYFGDAMLIF